MRGGPRLWDVGSQWIADGGVYPGMGDSIALAGTHPETEDGGLWNNGGAVGDPPFSPSIEEGYNSTIGAGVAGGPGYDGDAPGDDPDFDLNSHVFAGAVSMLVLGGLVFWIHDHITNGQSGHSPIKWTIGEIALVVIAGKAGGPLFDALMTWIGTRVPVVAPIADYVQG